MKPVPVMRSTKFDTAELQVEAIRRGERAAEKSNAPKMVLGPDGILHPSRESVVVSGPKKGYGAGFQLRRDAAGLPLPGRPTERTGQDPHARLILTNDVRKQGWHAITSYPTNEPLVPRPSTHASPTFLTSFCAWFSWDLFDPYNLDELLFSSFLCGSSLVARLDSSALERETTALSTLVAAPALDDLIAIEEITLGSWRADEETAKNLTTVLHAILGRLKLPV